MNIYKKNFLTRQKRTENCIEVYPVNPIAIDQDHSENPFLDLTIMENSHRTLVFTNLPMELVTNGSYEEIFNYLRERMNIRQLNYCEEHGINISLKRELNFSDFEQKKPTKFQIHYQFQSHDFRPIAFERLKRNQVSRDFIDICSHAGYLKHYTQTKYDPNALLTFEEMFMIFLIYYTANMAYTSKRFLKVYHTEDLNHKFLKNNPTKKYSLIVLGSRSGDVVYTNLPVDLLQSGRIKQFLRIILDDLTQRQVDYGVQKGLNFFQGLNGIRCINQDPECYFMYRNEDANFCTTGCKEMDTSELSEDFLWLCYNLRIKAQESWEGFNLNSIPYSEILTANLYYDIKEMIKGERLEKSLFRFKDENENFNEKDD